MTGSSFAVLVDAYQPLSREALDELLRERLRPASNKEAFDLLLRAGMHERDLKESYRGRAPYELLQNADDVSALGRWAEQCLFILNEEGFGFAHDGPWFSRENFISLTRGFSDKDPRICIGHKGLGFRSVLEVSPNPRVYRVVDRKEEFVAFEFCLPESKTLLKEICDRNPRLKKEWDDKVKKRQAFLPVLLIPKRLGARGEGTATLWLSRLSRDDDQLGGPYTTLFWFPAKDGRLSSSEAEEIGCRPMTALALEDFVLRDLPLCLPLLRHVRDVRLLVEGTLRARVRLELIKAENEAERVSVIVWAEGREQSKELLRCRRSPSIPPELKGSPEVPHQLKVFQNATIVATVRLMNERPIPDQESRFHVYLPTAVATRLGLSVHADYWVRPDRQSLMDSEYNRWLHREAAKTIVGPLLDALAKMGSVADALTAIAPTNLSEDRDPRTLREAVVEELQRKRPFVPSFTGERLLRAAEIVFPPREGDAEAILALFARALESRSGDRCFPEAGCKGEAARWLLTAAGAKAMSPADTLRLLEQGVPDWAAGEWLAFYRWAAGDGHVPVLTREELRGTRAILGEGGTVLRVGGGGVVCFHPEGADLPPLPEVLRSDVTFLHLEVEEGLMGENPHILTWVREHLGVRRFEASDLLPRLAHVVSRRTARLGRGDIGAILKFVRAALESGAELESGTLWKGLSRLPLPARQGDTEGGERFLPARTLYFPAEWPEGSTLATAIKGVQGASFLSPSVLELVEGADPVRRDSWVRLFRRLGVRESLRLLEYVRGRGARFLFRGGTISVGRGEEPEADPEEEIGATTGQEELNAEFKDCAQESRVLERFVAREPLSCGHGTATQELHRASLIDQFDSVMALATEEWKGGDAFWKERLEALLRVLPTIPWEEADTYFCHFSRGRGASRCGERPWGCKLVEYQVRDAPCVPTARHPQVPTDTLVRQPGHGLISLGRRKDDLNELLLPYWTAPDERLASALEHFGALRLDSPESARPSALLMALGRLGSVLAEPDFRKKLFSERDRWRRVRAAIQAIYEGVSRRINEGETVHMPGDLLVVVGGRTIPEVARLDEGLWYADAGSLLHRSFLGYLKLIDADQYFTEFFSKAGVRRLRLHDTVIDHMAEHWHRAEGLEDQIKRHLAPYLVALMLPRVHRPDERDDLVQRLVSRLTMGLAEIVTVELEVPELGLRVPARVAGGYHRARRESRPGGGEQLRHEIILEKKAGDTLASVDADVLGPLLANVLADQPTEDLGPQLARVINRYQRERGGHHAMERFFADTLSIPAHILEEADDLLRGEEGLASGGQMMPIELPPAKIPKKGDAPAGGPPAGKQSREGARAAEGGQAHDEFAAAIVKKSRDAFESLARLAGQDRSAEERPGGGGAVAGAGRAVPRLTPEQVEMGRQGEELVLEKLQRREWPGWALVADRRFEDCGYDLEVETPHGRRFLEIKTAWHRGGEISFTWNEFQRANRDRAQYRLMIVEAYEGPLDTWCTFYCDDPASRFNPEDVRVEGVARVVAPVERFQQSLAV